MRNRQLFEVICPVFNEQKSIGPFAKKILSVFAKLERKYDCRLIFVDNCSTDATRDLIQDLDGFSESIFLITMSRNYGYQCSIECGLRHSQGDITGIIDVDCEDPPELFLEFLAHFEEGNDIVYGERVDRPENIILKWVRKMFYRVMHRIADDYFILDMAEFSIFSREVREAILCENNSFPFIRASIGRVGFKRKNIPYKRQARIAGKTHYNLRTMTIFAIGGMLSSSTILLRIPAYAFPIWLISVSACYFVGFYFEKSSVLVLGEFLGVIFCGFTLTNLSIYSARIYKNNLQRPNFVVNKKNTVLPKQLRSTIRKAV